MSGTVIVDDDQVQVVALKRSQKGGQLFVRLQDTSARDREVTVRVKPFRGKIKVRIGRYGLTTLAVKWSGKKLPWQEVDLVERRR